MSIINFRLFHGCAHGMAVVATLRTLDEGTPSALKF